MKDLETLYHKIQSGYITMSEYLTKISTHLKPKIEQNYIIQYNYPKVMEIDSKLDFIELAKKQSAQELINKMTSEDFDKLFNFQEIESSDISQRKFELSLK